MANPWGYGFKSPSAPNSKVVQSDQEILDPMRQNIAEMGAWQAPTYQQNWLADASRIADVTGLSVEGARGYIGGANSGYATPDDQAFYQSALARFAERAGVTDNYNYNQQAAQDQNSQGLEIAQQALTNKTNELAQNTQRQTQAYGQMQGGNYFGGMMNEGYSDPFSGQVGGPGNAGGTIGGLGGLGGMPTNPQQNANYNASWQPEQRQFRAGTWGSPFGGNS